MSAAVLPPAVHRGDLVGVAALSSPAGSAALERGIEALEALGLRVRRARNIGEHWHLFAGEDGARLDGFHELVADDDVRAVFFTRGGHGVLRILPGVDWGLLASHPKAYVGYSDLTPLFLQIVERLDLVCFHGPMVASDLSRPLSEEERRSLLESLAGRPQQRLECSSLDLDGEIEGTLVGGCLSLLVACLGTPFFPELDDRLLFVEDVNEPLYRFDRMLTQLGVSGSLRSLKALILGDFQPTDTSASWSNIAALMKTALDRPALPMAWGVASGHGQPNLTLPLGARARLVRNDKSTQLIVGDDCGTGSA